MSKYFVAIYSICTCKIRLKMNSDSILHEERKKKKRSSYEIALHRSGHFVKKKSMSSSCRMSRGTCSNINKATPLSVIIFHRWQKEPNSNRWRIRRSVYHPLAYFYSFFYFEIGQKSIGGMMGIGQVVAQTRSHLFRYSVLEGRRKE